MVQKGIYSARGAKNFWVTERFSSKIATFERPFLRTLSNAIKASPTPKDAEFCQVYFSHGPFFDGRSRSLVISSFPRSDRKSSLLCTVLEHFSVAS